MSIFLHEQESAALEEAASRAIDLIWSFSEHSPSSDDDTNPWKDPKNMYAELDAARLQVQEAAQALRAAVANEKESNHPAIEEDVMKAQFVDMIADAFADCLEKMKDEVDVDILADCLQSGMELFSEEDRNYFLQDIEQDLSEHEVSPTTMTPHEARRQELGFVNTAA